jgi:hypothetical protein
VPVHTHINLVKTSAVAANPSDLICHSHHLSCSSTPIATHQGGMRFINDKQEPIALLKLHQRWQISKVAIHGEEAVGDHKQA